MSQDPPPPARGQIVPPEPRPEPESGKDRADRQAIMEERAIAQREDEREEREEERQKLREKLRRKALGEDPQSPETGTRYSATEIHDHIKREAKDELARPFGALLWSAIASGLTISTSFLAGGFVHGLVATPKLQHAAAAAAYPIGFALVVLARQQLFTENTLDPVIPLLDNPTMRRFAKMMRLWGAVLLGNMIGGLLMALFVARTEMLTHELRASLDEVAEHAVSGGFLLVLWRGVFAGWLVALMAWLLASTRSSSAQLALVWLTTAPIAALGFKHSIAGAVEAFYAALRGVGSWGTMLGEFVVPAILGNIVGGVLLVAMLNHGQVAHGSKR